MWWTISSSCITTHQRWCVWCGGCGVVWCGVVWCGVVWCGVVWCGGVWCGVVWCGVVWCGVVCWVWCGVVGSLVVRCILVVVGDFYNCESFNYNNFILILSLLFRMLPIKPTANHHRPPTYMTSEWTILTQRAGLNSTCQSFLLFLFVLSL